jgi:hypothetical protein
MDIVFGMGVLALCCVATLFGCALGLSYIAGIALVLLQSICKFIVWFAGVGQPPGK